MILWLLFEGVWIPTKTHLHMVSIYAPQDVAMKKHIRNHLVHIIGGLDGESIVMRNFNEVRFENERYGLIFNSFMTNLFNEFIVAVGLFDIPFSGFSFMWSDRIVGKMSKLDIFPMPKGLLEKFLHLSHS